MYNTRTIKFCCNEYYSTEFQAIQQDVASHQKEMVALTEHAQKLLDQNPDGLQPISEELLMFTDQYQSSVNDITVLVPLVYLKEGFLKPLIVLLC